MGLILGQSHPTHYTYSIVQCRIWAQSKPDGVVTRVDEEADTAIESVDRSGRYQYNYDVHELHAACAWASRAPGKTQSGVQRSQCADEMSCG